MKLPGEPAAGKIPDDSRLDVARVNSRTCEGRLGCFQNDVANGLALLLEIAFEVGASGSNDINRFCHNQIVVRNLTFAPPKGNGAGKAAVDSLHDCLTAHWRPCPLQVHAHASSHDDYLQLQPPAW